jgi:hypothetical protein
MPGSYHQSTSGKQASLPEGFSSPIVYRRLLPPLPIMLLLWRPSTSYLEGRQRERRGGIKARRSGFDSEIPSFLYLTTPKDPLFFSKFIFLNEKHVNPIIEKLLRALKNRLSLSLSEISGLFQKSLAYTLTNRSAIDKYYQTTWKGDEG